MSISIVLSFFSDFSFFKNNNNTFRKTSLEVTSNRAIGVVSGKIFEDINFGGGDGRNYSTADLSAQASGWNADDIALENVRVELYDNTGAFITNTTTNAAGEYTFTGLASGVYQVRVVNNTIGSNRASNSTGETIIPVQTFRTNGTTDVINEVGGAAPNLVDANTNTTNANLSTLTTGTTTAQSVTTINMGAVVDVLAVDFGYNFDVVVNTNNSGQGTLRQFILNSNELANTNLDQEDNPTNGVAFTKAPEWEISIFMIPGIGTHIIEPISVLKSIRDPQTHITGYTQAGSNQGAIAARTINVELKGNTTTYDAITIHTESVHVSGLSIHSFRKGVYANSTNAEDIFVWGNYIGTESDGTTIGTNVSSGVDFRSISNSVVGTNGDSINDANEGNLISNSYYGIDTRNGNGLLISGNYIGLDKTGTVDLGNRYIGVYLGDATGVNYVGFKDDLANSNANHLRNVIGGNGNDAVRISNSNNQVIAGNYLGTDVTGTVAIGNSNYGIQLQGTSTNVLIGTNSNGDDDILERNIISGNGSGFRNLGSSTGVMVTISGNYIGTDVTGLFAVPNLNNGIELSLDNSIIGTNGDGINDEIEGNIISGNLEDGIRVFGDANNNIIAGNKIGVGADGITPIGNGKRGIIVANTANNNAFGYLSSMMNSDGLVVGNQIKYNDDAGIAMPSSGANNRISRNQIADNSQLGIDLDYDLVSSNDNGDGDTGANALLNFPVLDTAYIVGTTLTILGFAPAGSEVEFFIADAGPNPTPLPSGYTTYFGEGSIYLSTAFEGSGNDSDGSIDSYNDDGTGTIITRTQNRFEFTFSIQRSSIPNGFQLTATSTDATNNTSEFSGVIPLVVQEICDNGLDDDGDGLIDYNDSDCICCKSRAPVLHGLSKRIP